MAPPAKKQRRSGNTGANVPTPPPATSRLGHDEEAKFIRRHREQAALGTCLICLDENPNIATLCCGNAVHLKCLAEWLSRNATCVVCRVALPQMESQPRSPPRPQPEIANVRTSTIANILTLTPAHSARALAIIRTNAEILAAYTSSLARSTSRLSYGSPYAAALFGSSYAASYADETTGATDETTVAVVQNTRPPSRPKFEWPTCHNLRLLDCTNNLCGR